MTTVHVDLSYSAILPVKDIAKVIKNIRDQVAIYGVYLECQLQSSAGHSTTQSEAIRCSGGIS